MECPVSCLCVLKPYYEIRTAKNEKRKRLHFSRASLFIFGRSYFVRALESRWYCSKVIWVSGTHGTNCTNTSLARNGFIINVILSFFIPFPPSFTLQGITVHDQRPSKVLLGKCVSSEKPSQVSFFISSNINIILASCKI